MTRVGLGVPSLAATAGCGLARSRDAGLQAREAPLARIADRDSSGLLATTEDHPMFIDGHVHIYPCHDMSRALDAAAGHVARLTDLHAEPEPVGVLMLAETTVADPLARFLPSAGRKDGSGTTRPKTVGRWEIRLTEEPGTLRATAEGLVLYLIAGRQVKTTEGLEVLALGSGAKIVAGRPLPHTLAAVHAANAVPVLPWGFGKWSGRRGRILDRFLADHGSQGLLLGDIGGRPSPGPAPRRLRRWTSRGFRILAGSDSLPIPGEEQRVGSYGTRIPGRPDPERPGSSVLQAILDSSVALQTIGDLQSLTAFLSGQLRLRLRRHFVPRQPEDQR